MMRMRAGKAAAGVPQLMTGMGVEKAAQGGQLLMMTMIPACPTAAERHPHGGALGKELQPYIKLQCGP
jgi:hypothetical protein